MPRKTWIGVGALVVALALATGTASAVGLPGKFPTKPSSLLTEVWSWLVGRFAPVREGADGSSPKEEESRPAEATATEGCGMDPDGILHCILLEG
jgi:hypothetical protein